MLLGVGGVWAEDERDDMGRGEEETNEDISEAVGHGTVLVMFRNDILATAVAISGGLCRHRWTVPRDRSGWMTVTLENVDRDEENVR